MAARAAALFKAALPYILIGLYCTNLGLAWRTAEGADASEHLLSFLSILPGTLRRIIPSIHPQDLLVGLCCGVLFRMAVVLKSQDTRKYRKGVEYGSARWGTRKDIEPFMDPDFYNNLILTKTEMLTMNSRPADPGTARNKNMLIIGGSGSGKTRYIAKPNILQCSSKTYPVSLVICDPKGDLVTDCGHVLLRNHYRIKIFSVLTFKKSMRYNPFEYIHSEKDILKLVTVLMTNTKGEGQSGDPFWDRSERLLYTALIAYIHYEFPKEEQNFASLLEMLNSMEVREDDEDYKNPVDLMFDELENTKPGTFAGRQYKLFKLAAAKTLKSVLISAGTRLAPFDIEELRDLTSCDELQLDTIGDRKTALFLIMSDTDPTFNFLIAMIYSQLFNLLCEKADDVYGGRLPVHVRCIVDECANIGQIPNLEKLMATIRSREISACLIWQAQSQIKALYKDHADTIIGNCDSRIFLGGTEQSTLKEWSEALGKETIDSYNTGESRGRDVSHSRNFQRLGHDLMSRDEMAVMSGNKCILQLRGVRPFLSDKYDLTQHPNYRYTADYDKRYTFDVAKYLDRRLKLRSEDLFNVIQEDPCENIPSNMG